MKNMCNYISLICVLISFNCEHNSKVITIKGKITNPLGEQASFIFSDTTYTTFVNTSGSFNVKIDRDSSDYLRFSHGSETTFLYLNPGDKIYLTIDTKEFDETIKYKNSSASSFLSFKYLLKEVKDPYGESLYLKTMDDYIKYIEDYKNELLLKLNQVDNEDFKPKELKTIDQEIQQYISQKEKMSTLSMEQSTYLWERRLLARENNFYVALMEKNNSDFLTMIELYRNNVMTAISKINKVDYQNKQIESLNIEIDRWMERKNDYDNMPKKGSLAIDFSYPDEKEKIIQLSSFKGSLVYVDVWATWCGPCIAEIPSLKQLEKDYQDKNIVFLSVSVDTDKDAWLKMVNEEELGGVQLWANGWSEITKSYAIFGIPRFMLFDEDGKIISVDAPRPTSEDIRKMFNEYL